MELELPEERVMVFQARELAAPNKFCDLVIIAINQGHDVIDLVLDYYHGLLFPALAEFHPCICEFGIDCNSHVCGEGPRCCGPNQYGLLVRALQGKPNVDGGVCLIPVLHLCFGQGGLASGAPGENPLCLG